MTGIDLNPKRVAVRVLIVGVIVGTIIILAKNLPHPQHTSSHCMEGWQDMAPEVFAAKEVECKKLLGDTP
jgi:hypothetical protein